MNQDHQRLCAWAGVVGITFIVIGLFVMGFVPPIGPSLTPDQVAEIYRARATEIRFGALLIIISAMFCAPYYAVIFLQLRRMEGKRPIGAYSQLGSGLANLQFFILPGVFFAIAGYRPDRSVDVLYALNDMAWLMTLFPWTVGAMQGICVGLAVLKHGTATSVYPRWVGFFNIWIAVLMATSSVVPFFKVGPFAWDGIIGFWVPASVAGLQMYVMCWMTLKAIKTDTDN